MNSKTYNTGTRKQLREVEVSKIHQKVIVVTFCVDTGDIC